MPQSNPYPLRVDKLLMEKFKVVATENSRSVNKEIEALMKDAVLRFEERNGVIQIPESDEYND